MTETALERRAAGAALAVDAVATHHRDGFRSGVARFNELLAERLGVPLVGLFDEGATRPLLSVKVSELGDVERILLAQRLDAPGFAFELFLHELCGDELESRLVERAARVHCGNDEIHALLHGRHPALERAWAPGLVRDTRIFQPAEITVFSFGMAHKLRLDMFRRLRGLLEASGRSHALYVSAANHETASLRDAQIVFEELHELFPDTLYFLGNLSDVAVYNHLRRATFFAAFFEHGVRANNTSVAAALELGSVVLTNLDGFSPPEYVHLENVVDVNRIEELPLDPAALERIGAAARETADALGWGRLVERLRG